MARNIDRFRKIQDQYESLHRKNQSKYRKQIDSIFRELMKEAAAMGVMVSLKELKKMFAFDDFPKLKNRVKKLLGSFRKSLTSVISKGVEAEMTLAAEKGSDIARAVVGKIPATAVLPKEIQVTEEVMVRKEVVDAFLQRRVNGLTLSDRVWKLTDQMKEEIEMILDLGIREGKSADELSRDLRKYLQHPDELYRRVRDEHGNLIPSKKAQAFHPGRGVYRSSYMNARRLAATETNIAYRKADYDRYQQLDFVVGIEIHLSNNHNCKGVPEGMFHDICDELAGKYPKDFLFVGWHPHCRCYVTTILKTDEELAADRKRMLRGEEATDPKDSANYVKDVPDKFKKWLEDNGERIKKAKNLPYFLRDNGSLDDEGEYRLKEFGDELSEIDVSDISEKLLRATKSDNDSLLVSFEPFSPVIRKVVKGIKSVREKNIIYESIFTDERGKILNDIDGIRTLEFPGHQGKRHKTWEGIRKTAFILNKRGIGVAFLPEKTGDNYADSLLKFSKKKYLLADFKYCISTNSNTIAEDLIDGFNQAGYIVLSAPNIDTGIAYNAIEQVKRKINYYGDIMFVNKEGKLLELTREEIKNKNYKQKMKGFL